MIIHPLLAENSLFHTVGEIFHPVFLAVADILAFIYGLIPNYAIAIALLTVVIMLILTPLTVKSTKSMMAMQRLQPEMKRLQTKYKGAENRQKLNEEMMKLYKEEGINPMGGCLPMFLQMPFLIILYDTIKGLTNTTTITKIVNGQKQPILKAHPRYISTDSKIYKNLHRHPGQMLAFHWNLALKPFSHHSSVWAAIPYFVMVALAVVLQYLQLSRMNRRNSQATVNKQMQTMQRVMPILMAYIYFLIPAAVVIYMVVSTFIRIVTQDVLFRMGIVQPAGAKEIGGAKPKQAASGQPKLASGSSNGSPSSSNGTRKPALGPSGSGSTSNGATNGTTNGGANGTTRPRPAPNAGKQNGRNGSSSTAGSTGAEQAAKAHPRAKGKRERKAR